MTKTIHAIYDTLSAMTDFIHTLTGWFGFGPIVVLMFLLFFFKLFQSIIGSGRIISFVFAFFSFTALWLTWNMSYYQEYKWIDVSTIYGFIFLQLLGVFLIYKLFSWTGKTLYRKIRNRGLHPYSVIEIYDRIDENVLLAKKHIRNRDHASALEVLNKMNRFLLEIPPAAIKSPEATEGKIMGQENTNDFKG